MRINKKQFEQLVAEAIDSLPKKIKDKLYNVAIFVENYPTKAQLGKLDKKNQYTLFGLFEGYCQASRLNFGPVLPDKITIFRQPICKHCSNEKEARQQIISTVKHEIAHHFGSDEYGARKASKK
ncbi:MAG: metallopeptidase family protein [Patescibacteria group bacterium]|nr:metallopeptidase family protein [Patescibacteria group bacterium]